jgi:hypothetical protein
MKKTSISSVVCFDIIEFSKKSKVEQQALKKRFDEILALAVIDIPENDRMIIDTDHGAIISCTGPLENALEDALLIALTARDEVINFNIDNLVPLYLLIGINLGSVKVEESINVNDSPKIIGEGLVEAQRIMSFANPNQILVSRAYYDMASKLTLEIAQMFEKYDMHAYEHDIYAVRLLSDKVASIESNGSSTLNDSLDQQSKSKMNINWRIFLVPILLAFAMLYVLNHWMSGDDVESTLNQSETLDLNNQKTPATIDGNTTNNSLVEGEQIVELPIEKEDKKMTQQQSEQREVIKKKAINKEASTKKQNTQNSEESVNKTTTQQSTVTPIIDDEPAVQAEDKSGWDKFTESIKQGSEIECTQAQRALNQCN